MHSFASLQKTYTFDDVFVREAEGVFRFGSILTSQDGSPAPGDLIHMLAWLFASPETVRREFTVGHLGMPYRHFIARRINGEVKLEFSGQSDIMSPNQIIRTASSGSKKTAIALDAAFGGKPFRTAEAVEVLEGMFFLMGDDGWQGEDKYHFVRVPGFYDRPMDRKRRAHSAATNRLHRAHRNGLVARVDYGVWQRT